MTRDEALQAIDRYETLSKVFGYPDAESLQAAKRIVWSLRHGPLQDPYFLEKISSLDHWAEVGFSVRKHARHGGAERVTVFALGDLSTARWLVEKHWPE